MGAKYISCGCDDEGGAPTGTDKFARIEHFIGTARSDSRLKDRIFFKRYRSAG